MPSAKVKATGRQRFCWLALALPYGATATLSLIGRPEVGSFLAPLLGPWAGLAFGHADCTLATILPLPSLALAVLGGVALSGAFRSRRRRTFVPFAILTVTWALAWCLAALVSVVNSTE